MINYRIMIIIVFSGPPDAKSPRVENSTLKILRASLKQARDNIGNQRFSVGIPERAVEIAKT